jgi:hypothetical protein
MARERERDVCTHTHEIYTPWKRDTKGGKYSIDVGERVGEKTHEREGVRERDMYIGREKLTL